MNNCRNAVRVFFRDRSWQVSVLVEDHYLPTQRFENDEKMAIDYAIQKAQEYSPCLYEKLSIDGISEGERKV